MPGRAADESFGLAGRFLFGEGEKLLVIFPEDCNSVEAACDGKAMVMMTAVKNLVGVGMRRVGSMNHGVPGLQVVMMGATGLRI